MNRIEWLRLLAGVILTSGAGSPMASDGGEQPSKRPEFDLTFKLWAAPEGSISNSDSPFGSVADRAGFGAERGRGEADLLLRRGGFTAELSARSVARSGAELETEGMVNQLFYEPELLGQHFTMGKKVMSWDVGFGFRPLDVVQREDRRAFHPFALEGIPLLAWEWFGEDSAWTLVYANPLRGRAPEPRDDESISLRHFQRFGALDLHLVASYSQRTQLEGGVASAAVLADALEIHGSLRFRHRGERSTNRLVNSPTSPLAASDPTVVLVSPDTLAALVGFTLTPGWDLSILAEAWFDPSGSTSAEWAALGALAERQRALLNDPTVPAAAVLGNLAWGFRAFDRPNLLRQNLLLRLSRKWERLEPSVDFLCTPEDGGWVATAEVGYQGEQTRLDGGLRLFGGPPGSAYRLLPESAIFFVALQIFL